MSEECKKFMEQAEIESKKGDHNLSAERWSSAGFCYSDEQNYAKASECFVKSSEESLLGKNRAGASDSLLYALIVLHRSGNKKEAANVIKVADSKGLGGMESIKFAKSFSKAAEGGNKKSMQEACNQFSHIIEDNYWLKKMLGKMGMEVSFS
jgi:hypothetical protein